MKKPSLECCLTPSLSELTDFKNKNVVVIDVFRATSTISAILNNGADAVIPVKDLEDCKKISGENILYAAERNGQKPPGFEFGNSPFDYPENIVNGKTVVLTTTNGTKAVEISKKNAKNIITGSFTNFSTVVKWLSNNKSDTILFCAGWKGQFSLEDTLFAGAVAEKLQTDFILEGDSITGAKSMYTEAKKVGLLDYAKQAAHFKRLQHLGIQRDMEHCLTFDIYNVLPIYTDGKLIASETGF
ncbi:MAG: 2-phosphosulfolactate phosphatase [Chitinophagaceae bacterium]|nr:MAG: 2-phosphosulfolactate phosphatase [Chitinophagaceae bacterium]